MTTDPLDPDLLADAVRRGLPPRPDRAGFLHDQAIADHAHALQESMARALHDATEHLAAQLAAHGLDPADYYVEWDASPLLGPDNAITLRATPVRCAAGGLAAGVDYGPDGCEVVLVKPGDGHLAEVRPASDLPPGWPLVRHTQAAEDLADAMPATLDDMAGALIAGTRVTGALASGLVAAGGYCAPPSDLFRLPEPHEHPDDPFDGYRPTLDPLTAWWRRLAASARARHLVHNVVAHPLMVLWPRVGYRLHDATVPLDVDDE